MKKFLKSWVTEQRKRQRPPSIPARMRIYAVGDIHGRADLLNPLLDRIDNDLRLRPIAHPLQIFIGDYIDRGPDPRAVIQRLVDRSRRHETIFLKGNHEAMLLDFMAGRPGILDDWRQIGALPTLISYGLRPSFPLHAEGETRLVAAFAAAIPEDHMMFLRNLRLSHSAGDYFFAHAGVRPRIRLDRQKEEDLLWIRDDFLGSSGRFGKVVVHGHTPVNKPDVRKNRINIDTGAFASGNLTCLVIEGEGRRFL